MSPMLPQLRLLCRLRKRWHQTLSYVSLVLLLMTRVMQYCAKVMETIIAIFRRYLNDTVLKTLNRSYIWLSHMMSLFMLFMFCVVFFFFFSRDGSGTNCEVSRGVGLALCEAFEQADKVNSSPLWSPSFVSLKTY